MPLHRYRFLCNIQLMNLIYSIMHKKVAFWTRFVHANMGISEVFVKLGMSHILKLLVPLASGLNFLISTPLHICIYIYIYIYIYTLLNVFKLIAK